MNDQIEYKIIPIRIASKVIDSNELLGFAKLKNELVLRVTDNARQEIVAKFFEDNRRIFTLQIQRYTKDKGTPHKTYFSFNEQEIQRLLDFINSIPELQIENSQKLKINDEEIKKSLLNKEQAYHIFKENKEVILEVIRENVTQDDIRSLVYRKGQLEYFENLLNNEEFFDSEKIRLGIDKDEALWQKFFENNTWIFGFGLHYIINVPLEKLRLEQVVKGYDVVSSGKRIDALMKSKGIISSFCFAEIKTHRTKLINSDYRPDVYPPSKHLAGGIAQLQKTVQYSLRSIGEKLSNTLKDGTPLGEDIFLYRPKSFLLIGKLDEFSSEHGVNQVKYSSFELFRRSVNDIDIITFDELLERAKFIVHSSEVDNNSQKVDDSFF